MQTQAPLCSTDIMVVDGYQQMREILTDLLELGSKQVGTAKDGAEVLRRTFEHLIPVVVIDEAIWRHFEVRQCAGVGVEARTAQVFEFPKLTVVSWTV